MPLRFQPNDGDTLVALVSQQAISYREVTTDWTRVTSATYTVLDTDRRLWVEVNPCTITFPLSSVLTFDVLIKDGLGTAGAAAANNIHTSYSGGETCDGLPDMKITSNRGFMIIGPNPTDTGYTKVG